MVSFRYPLRSTYYLFALSIFFTLILNFPFFSKIFAYLWGLPATHWLFFLAIPLVVLAFFYCLLSLLLIPIIDRWLMALLVLCSAIVSWMTISYGIVFDHTMIDNFAQTDTAEAKTYVSWASFSYVMIFGVIPAFFVSRAQIRYWPTKREILNRGATMALALLVFGGLAGIFYKDFAATGRNNLHVHQYLVPSQLIYSVGKYIYLAFRGSGEPFINLAGDVYHEAHEGKPLAFVLVLGETARAQNFSWNGYGRKTNAYTKAQGFFTMGSVSSCGTATAVSVPCMFSFLDQRHFSRYAAENQSNLLDVIQKSGVDVLWIDNNGGCKNVCNRVQHQEISTDRDHLLCDGDYCYDEILLTHLQARLDRPVTRDTLIVLHMIGSHGPSYYRRYPEKFRKFTPDCAREDIQNCSQDAIVNTYDNTIVYSDYVLAQAARLLQDKLPGAPTGLLYISDHGESLGENGLYLHGMPMRFAPSEQHTVPELMWFSAEFKTQFTVDDSCLARLSRRAGHSQDELSHTVLGLLHVSLASYSADLDALRLCHS